MTSDVKNLFQWEVAEDIASKVCFGISPQCNIPLAEEERLVITHRSQVLAIAKKQNEIAKLLRVIAKPTINNQANKKQEDHSAGPTSIIHK